MIAEGWGSWGGSSTDRESAKRGLLASLVRCGHSRRRLLRRSHPFPNWDMLLVQREPTTGTRSPS